MEIKFVGKEEKKTVELSKNAHNYMSQIFTVDGEYCMFAQTGGSQFNFINLQDGNRYFNDVEIDYTYNFTDENISSKLANIFDTKREIKHIKNCSITITQE